MKAKDCALAADLVRSLGELPDVRSGMKDKLGHYDRIVLELSAYAGDDNGGEGHGSAMIPPAIAKKVIDAAETIIRAELKRLGVE